MNRNSKEFHCFNRAADCRASLRAAAGQTNRRRPPFSRHDFYLSPAVAHQWQSDGGGYLMLEPAAAGKGAMDIVRYDAATGAKTILVSAQSLTPSGASSPLVIEEFTLSADNQRLLIFTNTERVWRSNTARLLGLRSEERETAKAWRRCETVHADVRQVFARRDAGRLRARKQYLCRKAYLTGPTAASRTDVGRFAIHDQRHLRLGIRGRAFLPRRLALVSRWKPDCILAARFVRRQRVSDDQQHRRTLSQDRRSHTRKPARRTQPRA